MPWQTYYQDKFKVPLTDEALISDMEANGLKVETMQKIKAFLLDDSILPSGDYRADPKFKEIRSESDLLFSSFSNVECGIDMNKIKQFYQSWNSEASIEKLLQETISDAMNANKRGNLQPKNLKKKAIIDISQFLLKEQEFISNIYQGSQLLMRAQEQLLFLKNVNPNRPWFLRNKDSNRLVIEELTETTSERFLFNLWFREVCCDYQKGDHNQLNIGNVDTLKKMSIKKESMEEFTGSSDPEIARAAKEYLHYMSCDAYNQEFCKTHKRNITLLNAIEDSPLWPTICKITSLTGMIANACFQFAPLFDTAAKQDQMWVGNPNIPYELQERVLMITNLRHLAIIKNAASSNYFTKRQRIIQSLQAQYTSLNPGNSLPSFEQLSQVLKQPEESATSALSTSNTNQKPEFNWDDEETKPEIKTAASKKKQKTPKAPKQESTINNNNNNNVSDKPKVEEPLQSITLSDAQMRFKAIWGNQEFSYSPRVRRWVNVAKHNQVGNIASFTDRAQATYAAIPEEKELRAILELHHCLPIHKIYADKRWRDQFTFPTDWQDQDGITSKGFGMICRLKINDKIFKGKLYVGFDRDIPQQIIHHCFVLNNRNDATYESFISAVNERPTHHNDYFYDLEETNQLLWDDILCELKGIGSRTQSITMKEGNREISVIPHNRV